MIISKETQHKLSIDAAKLIKNSLGKGPKDVHVTVFNDKITFTLSETLTPLEDQVLRKTHNTELIVTLRKELTMCLIDDWRTLFRLYNLEVTSVEGDIDINQNQGILIFTVINA